MTEKMICSSCGGEMNLHAEKLVYSETDRSTGVAMGGHIEEMHLCPRCGRNESRSCGST